MKRFYWGKGVVVGFLTSLVVMAVSYLGNLWLSLPFFPFDLFDWLARHLPGSVIEFGLRTIISLITALHLGPTDSTAKLAEQVQALGLVALTGMVFGLILAWIAMNKRAGLIQAGWVGGVVLWIGMAVVEISLPNFTPAVLVALIYFLVLFIGWGSQLARFIKILTPEEITVINETTPPTNAPDTLLEKKITRRNVLALAGTSLISAGVLLAGLAKFRQANTGAGSTPTPVTGASVPPSNTFPYGPQYTSGPAASPSLAELAARIEPAPWTRKEITPAGELYQVDINTLPPQVDASTWHLNLIGLVNNPLTLTLDQIQAYPAVSQAVTLSCISNLVGGDLIGTNYWTGVRIKDLLSDAGLKPDANEIAWTSTDGYFEGLSLQEAMDERSLLVYAMNGAPLTAKHGFPLRLYAPGHYGMRLPKWIYEMKLINGPNRGYWTARGWSATAVPMTTSVIDTVDINKSNFNQTGVMPLGGIAWAGDRGISKVELQIDSDPWVAAELRNPAVSPLTWVQWRYDWKAAPGSHTVQVRATNGAGQLQDPVTRYPSPEGATGIHSVTINI